MATYRFTAECTISLGLAIEADSLEEAVQKMRAANMRDLCHTCAGEADDEWSASEFDGTPNLVEAEDGDGNDLMAEVGAIESGAA